MGIVFPKKEVKIPRIFELPPPSFLRLDTWGSPEVLYRLEQLPSWEIPPNKLRSYLPTHKPKMMSVYFHLVCTTSLNYQIRYSKKKRAKHREKLAWTSWTCQVPVHFSNETSNEDPENKNQILPSLKPT